MADEHVTTDDSTGQVDQPANAGKTYSEADVERIVKERLERQKRATEAQRQKEADLAEQQRLEAQQEYKQLAEQREKQLSDLAPQAEKAARYEEALTRLLQAELAPLPPAIKELLDGKNPVDALDWVTKHKAELTKPAALDINAGNKGASVSKQDRINDAAQDLRKTGQYNLF